MMPPGPHPIIMIMQPVTRRPGGRPPRRAHGLCELLHARLNDSVYTSESETMLGDLERI